jgi:hypothetical protein
MERELGPEETELVGQWLDTGNRIEGDFVAARIEWLTSESLVRVAATGWTTLYRDLQDGRLWELTYPRGELHGGGPPRLAVIAPAAAAAKYGVRTS